jgi:hypothetical protein
MQENPPEKVTRRVAVILGPGGSSRNLLDVVAPLLGKDRALEMQGVFIEEADLRHAAALPFVKELCRVTFSVREFNSEQFERVLALRMRTAQRALELLARRAGVAHSFRNIRGSADTLLRETVGQSDITIFEPAGALASSISSGPSARPQARRVVVHIKDEKTCGATLVAALQLAGGDPGRLSILLDPAVIKALPEIDQKMRSIFRTPPGRIRTLVDSGAGALTASARAENPGMIVLSADGESTSPEFLADLRKRLRCPVCLVRFWEDQ